MKKKIIALALAGLIGLTACNNTNKAGSGSGSDSRATKAEPSETTTEAAIEAASGEDDTEAFMRQSHYLLDTIDSAEINKFVDALYAGKPALGETPGDIVKRVTDTLDFPGNGIGLWSNGGLICLELCNTSEMDNDGPWVNGRDNVCKINWNGYKFNDDFSVLSKEDPIIVANSEAYVNKKTPGSVMVEFHIFDEARANEVYEILVERMNKDHVGVTCEEGKDGKWKTYTAYDPDTDGKKIRYAEILMGYDEDGIGCYIIQYCVRFEPLEGAETAETEAVESSEATVAADESVAEADETAAETSQETDAET